MEISAAKWKYSDLIRVLFIIECSRSPENERRKTKNEKSERQNGRKAKMELLSDNLFSYVI